LSRFTLTRVLQFNIESRKGTYIPLIKGKEIVRLAKELNANTIVLFARDAWGRAYYKSKIAPLNTKLGSRDLIQEVVESAKREGLKVVVMVGHTTNLVLFSRHPEWVQRGPNGEVIVMNKDPLNFKKRIEWPMMCPNSPFMDSVLKEVDEILKYDVDGVLLDSFRYMPDIEGACFCNFCRVRHEKDLGRPLPTKADWDTLAYRESFLWRYRVSVEGLRKVKEKLSSISHYVILGYNNHPGGWRGRANRIVEMAREYIDVVFAECSETDYQPPGFIAEMVRLSLAVSGGKPVWASRNSFHTCLTTTSTSPVVVRQGLREAFIAGGWPLYLIFSSAYMQDPRIAKVVSTVYKEIERLEDYAMDARPIRYVGILFSNRSRDWGGRDTPEIVTDCIRGFYYALLARHLPLSYIADTDLDGGKLEDYKVLVLANAQSLSEQAVGHIVDYVKKGGGLLATYKTSIMDEHGTQLDDLQLGRLLGVRYRGEIRTPWSYIKIRREHRVVDGFSKGQLILWGDFDRNFIDRRVPKDIANHAYVEPEEEKGVIANIVFPLEEFGSEYENGRSPPVAGTETEAPAIVVNHLGEGRTLYFSGQVGRIFWRIGLADYLNMIYNAVLWLGGKPPISAKGPETFEMSAYELDDSILVHLLNYTYNQRILTGSPSAHEKFVFCSTHSIHPAREIIPIHDIELRIYGREVKNAKSLLQDNVKYRVERRGEMTIINIPRLQEYEVILIE